MGSIRNPKNTAIFATLPEGFRPPQDVAFSVVAVTGSTTAAEFTIQKRWRVVCEWSTSKCDVSFGCELCSLILNMNQFMRGRMERMDVWIKIFVTTFGGFCGYFFGGWDAVLQILVTMAIVDYITGVVAAGYNGQLKK
ncbi:hypothetical protein BC1_00011 [Bacillus phage BC-1]|nr:hypothetical protein BC1_00011 [Bacillus phage BC-1]